MESRKMSEVNPKFNFPLFSKRSPIIYEVDDDNDEPNLNKINFVDNGITVKPEDVEVIITKFLVKEIGVYIEKGFESERLDLENRVDKEIAKLREHVTSKLDKVCEEVIRELKSNTIKEEIIKGVDEKLNKLKELL